MGACVLAAALATLWAKPQPTVSFKSATECVGDHAKYRWAAKTERDKPPATIAKDHQVTPADVGDWEVPDEKLKEDSGRVGREKEWFQVTGKVVLVRAEPDGDLHVQLENADGEGDVQIVVEVPVNHEDEASPWDQIRKDAFDWAKIKFPFTTKRGRKLTLKKQPVIRVVGKAFFDAEHAGKTPNRRSSDPKVTVWEIHSVMKMEVVKESGDE
jgi:hypothetical protein